MAADDVKAALVFLSVFAALIETPYADLLDKWGNIFRKFKCRGESMDYSRAVDMIREDCQKDMKGVWCMTSCFFKLAGLLDDKYQLYSDPKKAQAKMVKSKTYTQKLAEIVTDITEKNNCRNKFPKDGKNDCSNAKKGTFCILMAINKECGLDLTNAISNAE